MLDQSDVYAGLALLDREPNTRGRRRPFQRAIVARPRTFAAAIERSVVVGPTARLRQCHSDSVTPDRARFLRRGVHLGHARQVYLVGEAVTLSVNVCKQPVNGPVTV